MGSKSHKNLTNSRLPLLVESAGDAPFGSVLGWKTPKGVNYGVVLGKSGSDFLCLTLYDKGLKQDVSLRFYRDVTLSEKLAPLMPGVLASVQRVPGNRAFRHGVMKGSALRPYVQAAAHLQLEGVVYTRVSTLLNEVRQWLAPVRVAGGDQ